MRAAGIGLSGNHPKSDWLVAAAFGGRGESIGKLNLDMTPSSQRPECRRQIMLPRLKGRG